MLSLVVVAVFVPMLIEAARAARNERAQRARGGIEPDDDVYELMRVAYPAAFLVMMGEAVLRSAPPPAVVVLGSTVFAGSKMLKWWAILALEQAWTFRVIVVPDATLVSRGPYRFVRHPNYIGVVGELASVALMTGAVVSGPIAIVLFTALLVKRIRVEERVLGAVLPPDPHEWSPLRPPDRP